MKEEEESVTVRKVIKQSPPTLLAYHTMMLCKYSHVRELSAVAGESWAMSQKLNYQYEYTASQVDVRQ
jgi:hypothetical protein